MAPPTAPRLPPSLPSPFDTETRLQTHLARASATDLCALLGAATIALLDSLDESISNPKGLAYFIAEIFGGRGALRTNEIRTLLLSNLTKEEASELCAMLQLPAITPIRTIKGIDFGNELTLEILERWYGLTEDEVTTPRPVSEGSQKAPATHKLHMHQLNAFRDLRRAIAHPPTAVLVHMPFGAGKLRMVATAALDLFRSEPDDKSIIWFAPGTSLCEEAFGELLEVWKQLGSRDTTLLRCYGEHPPRGVDQMAGAIAVIDIHAFRMEENDLRKLGATCSAVVFADAENLVQEDIGKIVREMSSGGDFSVVGILASPGDAIPKGPARNALMSFFKDPVVTLGTDEGIRSFSNIGGFREVACTVIEFRATPAIARSASTAPLDFDQDVIELSNDVERSNRLLTLLVKESKSGRVVYYATTAESARLFASVLPVLGVKARAVTSQEANPTRTLAIQKFVAQDEKVLCVHGFMIAGSSVPSISSCVMASPYRSKAAFLSTIGRLVQGRHSDLPPLRLILAADSQPDAALVASLGSWSTLAS